jgi:hypothetical protein
MRNSDEFDGVLGGGGGGDCWEIVDGRRFKGNFALGLFTYSVLGTREDLDFLASLTLSSSFVLLYAKKSFRLSMILRTSMEV